MNYTEAVTECGKAGGNLPTYFQPGDMDAVAALINKEWGMNEPTDIWMAVTHDDATTPAASPIYDYKAPYDGGFSQLLYNGVKVLI